jgi:cytochrome b pre-mRNA-processing protein 3
LVDEMFRDMDRSLREMGASDPAVPKKVRRMAEVYAGRIAAYGHSVEDRDSFVEALRRNVFAGVEGNAETLADYASANRTALAGQDATILRTGMIVFRDPEHEAN